MNDNQKLIQHINRACNRIDEIIELTHPDSDRVREILKDLARSYSKELLKSEVSRSVNAAVSRATKEANTP